MKDIFELMKLEPIDLTFLDGVVTHDLPTESEVAELLNDPGKIEEIKEDSI